MLYVLAKPPARRSTQIVVNKAARAYSLIIIDSLRNGLAPADNLAAIGSFDQFAQPEDVRYLRGTCIVVPGSVEQ